MSTELLQEQKCVPCQGGAAPLKANELSRFTQEISSDWQVIDNHHLVREFSFKDFKEALDFVVRVGELAEAESHHPNICLSWGKVVIKVWTHKIDGLHQNDFIFAAKVDQL